MSGHGLDAQRVLYRADDGAALSLEDLIAEGLDGAFHDRVPALRVLLHDDDPRHRLHACAVLTSWGDDAGFETAIAWARSPERVPWAGRPVDIDRFSGADAGFEMLADAVSSSLYLDDTAELHAQQVVLTRALLSIYHRYYFDVTLASVAGHRRLRDECGDAAADAIDAALAEARRPDAPRIDPGLQAAAMISAVAQVRDERAASLAETILREHHRQRVVHELAQALGHGTGPATLEVLERLVAEGAPMARQSLAYRTSRATATPGASGSPGTDAVRRERGDDERGMLAGDRVVEESANEIARRPPAMSAPMSRDELSRLIATLLTMTNERRARLPESSVRSMHGNILRQLEFMQSVLDDGRTPSIEEKNSLDLGVIAARELEQTDFDYADKIMLAVYNFSKL